MCYKNNWNDISTIEKQSFDGGECNSINSIVKMKKLGWKIKDIKVIPKNDSYDFVYIFNKNTIKEKNIDYKQIATQLNDIKKEDKKTKQLEDGKRIYNKNCKICHGTNGKKTPYNTSRAINTLDLEELQSTMRAYSWGEKDNGFARIMKPYAEVTVPNDIKNIYIYLNSIK
jgi:cytochrome c553